MVLIADRYEPTGNASWGGMGEVHECWDQHLSRMVMLKRVKRISDFRRLMDEKKALLLLRSKHVIELIDVVEFEYHGTKEHGLILEQVVGSDLSENDLNCDDNFWRTLWQIAAGISDIHKVGVIHRDIKPANIRVDGSKVVKILDFGLSREVGKDDKTRSLAGTLGYMAPELIGTQTISFTPAIDVYAFGITAIMLLNNSEACSLAGKAPSLKPKDLIPLFLDATLAQAVATCVSHNPASRPSMREVRDLLSKRLLQGRHRACVVQGSSTYELNAKTRSITLKTSVGSITVKYDGFAFNVDQVTGSVFINNQPAAQGAEMPSACVLTFGASTGLRAFSTFDVSRPEVIA
jgi:eukaryotic-like serine/threonine-protein kinase